jgi:hypothetical protein
MISEKYRSITGWAPITSGLYRNLRRSRFLSIEAEIQLFGQDHQYFGDQVLSVWDLGDRNQQTV